MKKHLSFETISDLFDGNGNADEKQHLSTCNECARVYAELEMMKKHLTSIKFKKIHDAAFDEAVMKRCRGKGNMIKKRHIVPVAAAALFAAIYFSAILDNKQPQNQPVAQLQGVEKNSPDVTASFVTDEVASVNQLKKMYANAHVIETGKNFITAEASYDEYQKILKKLKIADTSRYFSMAGGMTLAGSEGELAGVGTYSSARIVFTIKVRDK